LVSEGGRGEHACSHKGEYCSTGQIDRRVVAAIGSGSGGGDGAAAIELLLGIDLGTSSVKVVAVDQDGPVVARAAHPYPIETPRPGFAEQDPDSWWRATCACVREVLRVVDGGGHTAAVGLAGQMHALVPLGSDGAPVRPAIIWPDTRADDECALIAVALGAERLYALTGVPPTTGMLGPSLLWMRRHEPELFARIRQVLLPKDYVRSRLTGEVATDRSDASGTLLFDIRQGTWSAEILNALGIERTMLPPVLAAHALAGEVTQRASDDSGLPVGTPVVVGAGDQMAGALAIGVSAPGLGASVIGSGGQLITTVSEPVVDPEQRVQTFCHAVPDAWLLMGAVLSAGLSFDWIKGVLSNRDEAVASSHETLLAEAATVPPGADGLLFLPLLNGIRTPDVDPHARGSFVGLRLSHSRAHLVRAVLEGVAYAMREALTAFDDLGVDVTSLVGSGGGARHPLWRQIQADVYGRPLSIVSEEDHSGYGAALLAGIGAGRYESVDDARLRHLPITGTVAPDPSNREPYDRLYGLYRTLYPALKPVFAGLG
jgi:xylulokinase